MGRTVLAVVGVVAAIAIAVVAPYLAPLALGVLGITATTTAVAIAVAVITVGLAAALSLGMGLAYSALGVGAPSAKATTKASYPQGTAVVSMFGARLTHPLESTMPAVQIKGLRSLFHWSRFRRFHIIELVGNCMEPHSSDHFAIVDLKADIRRGDYFSADVRDFRTAWHADKDVTGFSKRFRGVNWQLGFIESECFNPPMVIHCGLSNVTRASRIRASASLIWRASWIALCDRPMSVTLGTFFSSGRMSVRWPCLPTSPRSCGI